MDFGARRSYAVLGEESLEDYDIPLERKIG